MLEVNPPVAIAAEREFEENVILKLNPPAGATALGCVMNY
jgi:hypothetical protein